MSEATRGNLDNPRSSFVSWFTFVVGAPLGVGTLYLIDHGPWQSAMVQRYTHHLAEQVIVVLFFCSAASLAAKLILTIKERYVQSHDLLPHWDGKPIPAGDVTKLQQSLQLAWDRAKGTYLGKRIANVLNFVHSRGSANELDDQLRTLSDNDAIALDSSYALLRFIIWAMPILGFLGTVLGITDAIAGISPEQLEKGGAGDVTQGLTVAFDSTALALGATMVAMFFNYLVEKLEQNLLERVDQYVDAELAHRFVRTQGEATAANDMMPAMQQLLEKQISLWTSSMQRLEERMQQSVPQQQEKWAAALQQALDASLTRFGQRMVETEKKLIERQQVVLESVVKLAAIIKDNGQSHQMAVARLTDAIGLSVEMTTKMQTSETQLLRLQETLNQNLSLLANSATFEQAVESLTAAIQLLTMRVKPDTVTTPRIAPISQQAA
jgi:biopolymer transport protein ExbB/TolQ